MVSRMGKPLRFHSFPTSQLIDGLLVFVVGIAQGGKLGHTETEIDEFLENIDYHALLQAVWNKAERSMPTAQTAKMR